MNALRASYPLLTARLQIRPLGRADVEEFVAYRRDPDVARWQSWGSNYGRADALALIDAQPTGDLPPPGQWLQLAVRSLDGTRLFGDLGVHRIVAPSSTFEIGVSIAGACQGRGLATEALRRLITFLFHDAAAHRIVAYCDARNSPVKALLARVGLRQETSPLPPEWFKGEWSTLEVYALLAGERPAAVSGPGGRR